MPLPESRLGVTAFAAVAAGAPDPARSTGTTGAARSVAKAGGLAEAAGAARAAGTTTAPGGVGVQSRGALA
ncbi:hypothetical protein BST12_18755 [Mycobacterium angelicum]|uniref:Uncharacterized protein n=1 Tax=Mycobacterium angelicum TaxID=470074 RepID=A0A1W9ZLN5_MYCAN|nr:hypothetical protein BST12_18755 [Mycobacterium angelicum]